jgi:alkanesulfonate monooxygenase SsuD/methylene tetrahydromethanopterin reductase-like flavin-dependent oxidoreductase (luciferase family)
MAASVDVLSKGRLVLGLGAGWNQDEHVAFGIPFADTPTRLAELERGIVEIRRIHRDFNPKPVRSPMPILVGGSGKPVSLGIAARQADEYNVDGLAPDDFAAFSRRLDDSCRAAGRAAESMRRSVTLSVLIAGNRQQLRAKAGSLGGVFPDYAQMGPDEVLEELAKSPGSWVVGTPDQVAGRVSQYVPAGASRVILTVWLLDDLEDTLNLLAREVAPALLQPSGEVS